MGSLSSIGGSVVDAHGDGIEAVKVTLGMLPNGPIVTKYTDGSGSFVFSDLRAGNYHVSVSKTGFAEDSRDISLKDNEKNEFTMSLKPGGIRDSITVLGGDERLDVFNGLGRMGEISGLAIYAGKKE